MARTQPKKPPKRSKLTLLQIHVSEETKASLHRAAADEEMSLSDLARRIFREYLAASAPSEQAAR